MTIAQRTTWLETALEFLEHDHSATELRARISETLELAHVQRRIAEALGHLPAQPNTVRIAHGGLIDLQGLYSICREHGLWEPLLRLLDVSSLRPFDQDAHDQLRACWGRLCHQYLPSKSADALPRLSAVFVSLRDLAAKPGMCPLDALVLELEKIRDRAPQLGGSFAASLLVQSLGAPAEEIVRIYADLAARSPLPAEALLCALEQYARLRPRLVSRDAVSLVERLRGDSSTSGAQRLRLDHCAEQLT